LLGDGWLTEGQPYWDGAQLAWFNTPNIPSIVDGLEAAYARGKGRSDKARAHAKQYDADVVWDQYWRPYLEQLAEQPAAQPVALASEAPAQWWNGKTNKPTLSIYIPTYKRHELRALLESLAGQLTDRTEVIVADDDPAGSGWQHMGALADAPCQVQYYRSISNLGAIANSARAYDLIDGNWLWIIGDDDQALDNAVGDILAAIDDATADRLIMLTKSAPQTAAGMTGTPAEIAKADPGLLIAATCISANVVNVKAIDLRLAMSKLDTMMHTSFSDTACTRVRVLDKPCIYVGPNHAGEVVKATGWTGDMHDVWTELLGMYGVDPVGPEHFAWNFVSVQR
jgi:hypothetical protein